MSDSEEPLPDAIKEQILDLTLDEVASRPDLLEYGVPSYLRKSASKRRRNEYYGYYNDRDMIVDEYGSDSIDLEQVWSNHKNQELLKAQNITLPELEEPDDVDERNQYPRSCGKIHAFNLLYEVTDEDIQKLFGLFGPLERAHINFRPDGRSKGTAFIVYTNKCDAKRAFRLLDGYQLDGRKLCLRLIDCRGIRGIERHLISKRKGDQKPVDFVDVFEDTEQLTENDLEGLDLDTYVRRRKKAKTWNYY